MSSFVVVFLGLFRCEYLLVWSVITGGPVHPRGAVGVQGDKGQGVARNEPGSPAVHFHGLRAQRGAFHSDFGSEAAGRGGERRVCCCRATPCLGRRVGVAAQAVARCSSSTPTGRVLRLCIVLRQLQMPEHCHQSDVRHAAVFSVEPVMVRSNPGSLQTKEISEPLVTCGHAGTTTPPQREWPARVKRVRELKAKRQTEPCSVKDYSTIGVFSGRLSPVQAVDYRQLGKELTI